jgi:4-amino-4-deoxy-L-arabinose transferase-like glycosyltransferase
VNPKYYLLFVPILIVYLIGMFNDVMEIDASQYAAMSREMMESGNYLQLYDRGSDYLDKPPLLFWVSSFSFKVFGISNFSYRLPSVLFSLLGIFATMKLGKKFYGEKAGFYAALILASSQAWFLMNHDVRTDTILAACTIIAIWQLFLFLDNQKVIHLVVGSIAIAGAMLTKGPIGIMVPALSIGSYLLVKRDWKKLFDWKWLLLPMIVLVCISPFLYGLYQQYDSHPGKTIQGVPIKSGIQFYLWTQSFGRITGESVWKDDTSRLFFTHTFLWSFLPWCVLFVITLWKDAKQLINSRFQMANAEVALTWGGFVFPFIAFSLSNYKLPHYIFVIFPLAALATARMVNEWIENNATSMQNSIKWIQFFVAFVVYALGAMLCGWALPISNILYWSIFIIGVLASLYFVFKGKTCFEFLMLPSLIAIIVLNFLLNAHFYPTLFNYESSNQAAKLVRSLGEEKNLKTIKMKPYGLDVYSHQTIQNYPTIYALVDSNKGNIVWVFTNEQGHKEILNSGVRIIVCKEFENFHVSALSILFLNPSTRAKEISHTYLDKIDLRDIH